ncbi:hypothetical protein A3K86_16645 [Photobacterium jeanii]|uniref:VirK protein n=1 Tax=Photobacterium jeanii TaxID=858640 RepID=A0A178K9F2_9GAMM|nr:DUF535 family protein [Photobacterium jeanii]OAN13283.1 hypothetical protein A3K86_16645 [Photobacterium jeanii]PST90281.1 DUF535 domain-containing protein [Photobacterium jeanii]
MNTLPNTAWGFATCLYPKNSFKEQLNRIKFVSRATIQYSNYRLLKSQINSHPLIPTVLKNYPRIIEKPLRSFLNTQFSSRDRIHLIVEHYDRLCQLVSLQQLENIYTQRFSVAQFECREIPFDLTLSYENFHEREGELTLALRQNDQRIYSAPVTLGTDEKRQPCLYLGTVQGSRDKNEITKSLTRGCHGLRPKSLMIEYVKIMARHFGCENIYAVSNSHHVYQSKRKTQSRRSFDLDSLITEHGGEAYNAAWSIMTSQSVRHDFADVVSRKRKMYRLRYEFIDDLEQQVQTNLPLLPQNKLNA